MAHARITVGRASTSMHCSQLIERFTEYLDGSASTEELRAMEAHLADCASCRRYKAVLEHGSSLLKSLPTAGLREDFAPRLQHRLYHVHEERSLADQVSSGAPALTVLGIAILLAAVAWAPLLRASAPVVELQPIVVDRAPPRWSGPPGTLVAEPMRELRPLEVDLWDDALLYEFSNLNRDYRSGPRTRQVGLAREE